MASTISRTFGDIVATASSALVSAGLPKRKAELTGRSIAVAEAWELPSHGLLRLPIYVARTRAGGYPADARLSTIVDTGPLVTFDGGGGLGHWQLFDALDDLYRRVAHWGVAVAAIGNSGHCGALGVYAASAAENGYVGLVFSSGPPTMPAWGGSSKLLSTSPVAAAFPDEPQPALIDMALSAVARGTVAARALHGAPLEEGWAFDAAGTPTTDARAALHGMLAPIGGPKGFALAYLVEALTAGLVGPALSSEQPDFFDPESFDRHQGIAHLLVVIDPAKTSVSGEATERIRTLADRTAASGGRAPGSRRIGLSALTDDHPVEVDALTWARIDDINGSTDEGRATARRTIS